ncbi:RNA-directed DNA polymerase from mobile element jockey [Trichonephila clavipes]|nr:RNA-directed DNA polymerase from mobile element jockey [Trichonephila clavipes]
MGGLWEAGIKSVKYHLKRALGRSRLTYEEFETVIIQVKPLAENNKGNSDSLEKMEYRLSEYSPTERKVDDREGQCNVWYNGNCKGGFYTSLQLAFRRVVEVYHGSDDDHVVFPGTRTAGGTAIYCKSNFVQSRAPLPGIQYMDATAIGIKINNFPPLRVVSAYARFCAEINRKFPEKDFLKILNSGNNLIIAGDLNTAHKTWNNTRSNNFGFRLKRIIQNYPNARIIAPYTPTHINSRSRPVVRDSITDLAVFKNIPFNYDIRVIDDLCSDHLPVILTLYTNSDTMKIPEQFSTNWENFRFLLKNKPLLIPASPSNEHLDVAIGRLGENISEALVAASKSKFKTAPIKLPPDIRSKIRHRNRVRRFWQRSRDPALKNELRTISSEIASDSRHLSRTRWEKTIEELSPETCTLWRRTFFLKKPFHHIPP